MGTISEEKLQKLRDYIDARKKEEEELENANVSDFFHIHSYERGIIAEYGDDGYEPRIVPTLVIVLYGWEWLNFIEGLLAFANSFPGEEFLRSDSYAYTLMDEHGDLSDVP